MDRPPVSFRTPIRNVSSALSGTLNANIVNPTVPISGSVSLVNSGGALYSGAVTPGTPVTVDASSAAFVYVSLSVLASSAVSTALDTVGPAAQIAAWYSCGMVAFDWGVQAADGSFIVVASSPSQPWRTHGDATTPGTANAYALTPLGPQLRVTLSTLHLAGSPTMRMTVAGTAAVGAASATLGGQDPLTRTANVMAQYSHAVGVLFLPVVKLGAAGTVIYTDARAVITSGGVYGSGSATAAVFDYNGTSQGSASIASAAYTSAAVNALWLNAVYTGSTATNPIALSMTCAPQ